MAIDEPGRWPRWGILGAARISGKVVPALRDAGGEPVVVGASSRERASAAARELSIPEVVADYAAVVEHPDVDAVYLPLANHQHREWLLRAAAAGKHCLCEKPLAVNAADAREVRAAFRAAGRRVMEAFMWRHHPQVACLRQRCVPGDLGEPRRVQATFSFFFRRDEDYRWVRSFGGGALLDIGGYCVNAARYFFRAEPVEVSARATFRPGEEGVDESLVAWLDFGEDRLATFGCSFASGFSQAVELVGTEGRARLVRPWNALGEPAPLEWERGHERGVEEIAAADPYRNMAAHFADRIRDPERHRGPGEDGVAQAVVLDALRESALRRGEPVRVGAADGSG